MSVERPDEPAGPDGRTTDGVPGPADQRATQPPRAGQVLLVRHRQSTWNAQRLWTGQADPPLSGDGEAEALALGETLSLLGFTAIVCSDLARARRTAELVRAAMPWTSLHEDPRLRELSIPAWEGRTKADIRATDPHRYRRWKAGISAPPPGSESWPLFEARVRSALEDHTTRDAITLVVAHSGVLRAVRSSLELPHKVSRSKGIWLEQRDGRLAAGPLMRLARSG